MTEGGMYIALELADCDLNKFWVDKISKADHEAKFMIGVLIFMYVLRALVFLEKLSIVHGDIKPANLVVIEREKSFLVKLIDFGTVERLDTKRSQKTVGSGKAYTPLFVAPEFLNFSVNPQEKRVHKRADVWSAGVMFYFLLYEAFPWAGETDYIRFANLPDAMDIVAPEKDGFEDIIHLLMKKSPQQRSSAEQAMMAMKNHEKLKVTVQTLEKKFYRIDDVCQVIVPDEIQRVFAQREHVA
ncbi:unnamed protein product [Rotaria sp. Silwood2]|nr:unnamed protein product [Rotaria sp. Silwood2]